MKQQIWSGLIAALCITTAGVASSSQASGNEVVSQLQPQLEESSSTPQARDAIKMGEHQSQATDLADAVVATIHPHSVAGRDAVSLYVRSIPVLTFLGSQQTATTGAKVATIGSTNPLLASTASQAIAVNNPQDPVWRATTVAAKLNQLRRSNFDAKLIKVIWDPKRNQHVVRAGSEHLVELNAQTVSPDKTNNSVADALQVTNRLRRLLGDAPPLSKIPGRPVSIQRLKQVVFKPLSFLVKGWASWYGPGFHGRHTASGERFNQYALTAAHRSLPFGTRVRVTNTRNGHSVIVRINDRGPYSHGRVIDLSRKAAQVIGVVQSGTAPVRVDVVK